ncbi:MAG: hypothetical protein DI630_00085 [Gordonia sp. (in: high G+C Gram-positive bacteria)]|nr:MAG: hypothetical protein DI630_00085 [Gordonia sp. (in: high G+C Gram-positive bacteria)]
MTSSPVTNADRSRIESFEPMQITIEIEDTYANGDEFVRTDTVTVEPPAGGEDLQDWAADTLLEFTGQGGIYVDIDGTYDIKVLECADRPELVGQSFSFG